MKRILRKLTAIILVLCLLGSTMTVLAWDLPDADNPEFNELFPIPSFLPPPPTFEPEEKLDLSSLAGKSILFYGDSYTMGYGLEDFSQTWCAMLETEYDMDVTCWSIHGATMALGFFPFYGKGGSFCPVSYRPLPEGDFDIIFVNGGSNDWYCEIPLWDEENSRNTRTFIGAINTTIDNLQKAYPDALIVFMTPWVTKGVKNFRGNTTDDYSRVMVDVCSQRDIPCFEAYLPWVSHIFADQESFRSKYFLTSSDPWHLNAAGQQYFLPTIAQWLQEQVEEHVEEAAVSMSAQRPTPSLT